MTLLASDLEKKAHEEIGSTPQPARVNQCNCGTIHPNSSPGSRDKIPPRYHRLKAISAPMAKCVSGPTACKSFAPAHWQVLKRSRMLHPHRCDAQRPAAPKRSNRRGEPHRVSRESKETHACRH